MMDVTTSVVATGAVAAAGRWAAGQQLDVKFAIGVGALAVVMAMFSKIDQNIAEMLGLIVLLGVSAKYLPAIVAKLGWTGLGGRR